uniref:Fasciculation and elongation protein zeta 2a n=1 Tax=Gasterosteus aculeatus aculeatus TaxID=481459 RepID=A0AAQ4R5P1_GASAC|nr:fasciculation and elongation protein zeta-2 isoform X1 [Gasterosteus aculeatus aculeatus]
MAAPVALLDDDRPISGVSSSVSGRTAPQPQKSRVAAAATEAAPRLPSGDGDGIELPDSGFSSWESRAFRSSVDRGKDFEEKLTVCFPSVTADTESLARGGAMSADSLPEEDELWKVLTSSYGHVMPVDWKLTSSLHVPTFHLEENPTDVAAEVSDEEELREHLDTHSIIVSSLSEEPFFTVEQVIEEIEEMMEDSPDTDARPDLSQSDRSTLLLDVQRSTGSPGYESRVRTLSVAELNERLEDSETNIMMFSEELVQQLALRDELGFEKEVKNSFISALIDVQNRQKEQRELLKKKKKLKVGAGTSQSFAEKTPGSRFSMEGISSVIQNSFRHTFGSACRDRQYLTTVIPYEKKGHPPSLKDLQTLTTILQAMRDDSDKVPSLLTDYILKVLCPT